MVKKLASKLTKELLAESEIKEKGLKKSDFNPTWQGRLYILDPEKSAIAQKILIKQKGEYAIKVR